NIHVTGFYGIGGSKFAEAVDLRFNHESTRTMGDGICPPNTPNNAQKRTSSFDRWFLTTLIEILRVHWRPFVVSQCGSECRDSFSRRSVVSVFAKCRSWRLARARSARLVGARGRRERLHAKQQARSAWR